MGRFSLLIKNDLFKLSYFLAYAARTIPGFCAITLMLRNNFTAKAKLTKPVPAVKTNTEGSSLFRAEAIKFGIAQALEPATSIKLATIFATKNLCAVSFKAIPIKMALPPAVGMTLFTNQIP